MTVLKDIEDMKAMALDAKQVDELVGKGGTCVLMWSTADGHPVGVTMAYVYRDGVFWTTPGWRKRAKALKTRPKSSIVVIKDGSSVTFKGRTIIHGPGDKACLLSSSSPMPGAGLA
jgi:nitroimidazol reductase NimA-like FMN-containing flavoprotein (pyridoxamine 5'-phosphate oxidase superfamily)